MKPQNLLFKYSMQTIFIVGLYLKFHFQVSIIEKAKKAKQNPFES